MTLAKQAEKFAADNSPLILTAIGVTGTITTALLTGKASIKAGRLFEQAETRGDSNSVYEPLAPKEKVKLAWRYYIPAATTGVLTVACIITANQIGTRRAVAMATAYGLSEKMFAEYKDQVIEKLGETKERTIRDDLAQKQVNENPVSERQVIITGGGNVLCYEPYTDRYFYSNMESLKKAQNDLNYQVLNNYYASLSDFYDLLGLKHTTVSDDVGWNSDEMLELDFATVLSDSGIPCISINYKAVPLKGYYRVQ